MDAKKDAEGRVHVGQVTLHFLEDSEGTWYSLMEELDESKCRGDLRTVYKMALLMASVQATLQDRMTAIDAIIKSEQELQKIHNELVEEKHGGKNRTHKAWQVPDTEKYQTKLPFDTEDKNDTGDS